MIILVSNSFWSFKHIHSHLMNICNYTIFTFLIGVIVQVHGQSFTNEALEQFGFKKKYIALPCDGNVLLESKKSNLCTIYSVNFKEDFSIQESPYSILEESFDSIKYYYSNQDWTCQFFYFKKGKMGYLPTGQFPTKKNKITFEWDAMILPETTIDWDGQLLEFDWYWVKKNDKWGVNFISKPHPIVPCIYETIDQIPKITVTSNEKEAIVFLQKKHNSSYVIPLIGNYLSEYRGMIHNSEDFNNYYQIQNIKSKQWGVYRIEGYEGKFETEEIFAQKWEAVEYEYLFGVHGTILAQKNGLWGRYDLQNQYPLTEHTYQDKNAVPKVYIDRETYQMQSALKKKFNADLIEYDLENGDGVAKIRSASTGLWGIMQSLNKEQQELHIPMVYDSVDFIGYNAKLTGVWLRGKVGIYMSPWTYGAENAKQTVACLYDDYKIFNVEKTIHDGLGGYRKYFDYVAVKKDGLWAWIDWMTGELKTEFLYDLEKEQMPYPDFEQEN